MNAVSMKGVSFNPQGGNGESNVIFLELQDEVTHTIFDDGNYAINMSADDRDRICLELFGSEAPTLEDIANAAEGKLKDKMVYLQPFHGVMDGYTYYYQGYCLAMRWTPDDYGADVEFYNPEFPPLMLFNY